MDYGYNFVLVLKNLPYSFLMIVKISYDSFLHSPVDGCLSCLQYFSVKNYAAVDILYTYFYVLIEYFLKDIGRK